MTVTFIWYPKCSTCQKAAKWLNEHGIEHNDRHIVEENPTAAELAEWVGRSGKPSKSFFNTSGNLYKAASAQGQTARHAGGGAVCAACHQRMLVKRPIVLAGDTVLVGFKPAEWEEALLK